MAKVYRVTRTADERAEREALARKGTGAAPRLIRARILRKAGRGPRPDGRAAAHLVDPVGSVRPFLQLRLVGSPSKWSSRDSGR